MGVESATYISDLVSSAPGGTDLRSQGDDHIRLLKSVLQATILQGSRAWTLPRMTAKTANFSPASTDDEQIYLIDTTSGNVTVTLPAVPAIAWQARFIKTSSDVNTVTISGTVGGRSLPVLATQDDFYHVVGNGSAFYVGASVKNALILYSKIQNVTSARLLGNPTGIAAAPSEIALGANLSFAGSTLVATFTQVATTFLKYLGGLELSTAGSSSTFGVAVGSATDTTSGGIMTLASAYTKTTASWAVGTGNGSLDTGAIAINTWYHVFLIKRPDTSVVDILISLSATAPTLPTNYTVSRRIGAMKTDGSSQWTAFAQTYDTFIWAVAVQDVNGITTTTSRVNKTLTVPTGVNVEALFRGSFQTNSGSGGIIFSSTQENTAAASSAVNTDLTGSGPMWTSGSFERITNTSAQIGARSNISDGAYSISTYGWKDFRGK